MTKMATMNMIEYQVTLFFCKNPNNNISRHIGKQINWCLIVCDSLPVPIIEDKSGVSSVATMHIMDERGQPPWNWLPTDEYLPYSYLHVSNGGLLKVQVVMTKVMPSHFLKNCGQRSMMLGGITDATQHHRPLSTILQEMACHLTNANYSGVPL